MHNLQTPHLCWCNIPKLQRYCTSHCFNHTCVLLWCGKGYFLWEHSEKDRLLFMRTQWKVIPFKRTQRNRYHLFFFFFFYLEHTVFGAFRSPLFQHRHWADRKAPPLGLWHKADRKVPPPPPGLFRQTFCDVQKGKTTCLSRITFYFKPYRDETNKVAVRPAKTQISLGIRPVWSVFAVRMKETWVLSYPLSAERRLCSDWADAQADLSLRWAHTHFVGFVTRRLIF